MKPLYITLISVALTCIINSNAVALNIGDLQPDLPIGNPQCSKSTYWEICSTLTTTEYIGCSTSECLKCENSSLSSTTPNSYGVLQDSNYKYKANCEGWQSTCSCYNSTSFTCGAGYYGTATSATSGCTQCPTWSGVYTDSAKTTLARGTSSNGTTVITGCYIKSGTYYDATGTFKLEKTCKYTE